MVVIAGSSPLQPPSISKPSVTQCSFLISLSSHQRVRPRESARRAATASLEDRVC
jgi:hypothetical protein